MKVFGNLILGEGSFRGILLHLCFLLFLYLYQYSSMRHPGYVTSRNQKFNHLLFTDDLKLDAKSERELVLLIQT